MLRRYLSYWSIPFPLTPIWPDPSSWSAFFSGSFFMGPHLDLGINFWWWAAALVAVVHQCACMVRPWSSLSFGFSSFFTIIWWRLLRDHPGLNWWVVSLDVSILLPDWIFVALTSMRLFSVCGGFVSVELRYFSIHMEWMSSVSFLSLFI